VLEVEKECRKCGYRICPKCGYKLCHVCKGHLAWECDAERDVKECHEEHNDQGPKFCDCYEEVL
jgi:hypothetical protein